jgi:rRNA maturation endonuclease Nob1
MKNNKRTYQWISDNYGKELGLNHPSSVRKVFIDSMIKVCRHMLEETGQIENFSKKDIKQIAESVEFQEFVGNCYADYFSEDNK